MSAKIDVKFRQRFLACAGFTPGRIDGYWGPRTEAAEQEFLASSARLKKELGSFDARSEANIATLLPPAQIAARRLLAAAAKLPFTVRVISGTRSYAEQDRLFAQGRNAPGRVVTAARGGQSNHNFGIAFDVGLFSSAGVYYDGDTAEERRAYAQLAEIAKREIQTLEWGGDWIRFPDPPHYQLKVNKNVSDIRRLFEAGVPFDNWKGEAP